MPKPLKILTAPNESLTTPTKAVKKFDKKLKDLIEDMIETLKVQKDPEGVGLAANQVGANLSLFILWPDHSKKPKVFINPKILKTVKAKKKKRKKEEEGIPLEGCLSIPKIWGEVERAEKVLVEYQDETGKKKKEWFEGMEAVIIQHEIDHLNGILFTQHVISQGKILYKETKKGLKPLEL